MLPYWITTVRHCLRAVTYHSVHFPYVLLKSVTLFTQVSYISYARTIRIAYLQLCRPCRTNALVAQATSCCCTQLYVTNSARNWDAYVQYYLMHKQTLVQSLCRHEIRFLLHCRHTACCYCSILWSVHYLWLALRLCWPAFDVFIHILIQYNTA